jgi:LysM repeat protein
MRTPIQVLLTTLAVLAVPATASANFAHTVTRGESLYSVAAADGLSLAQLAAANGLSTNSQLVTGATLQIPPQTAGASTTQTASASTTQAAPVQETSAPTSSSSDGYVVQPGDTLSAIAAANGISVDQLAAENGLAPSGILQAGATLAIGGSSPAGSTSASTSAARSTSAAAPASSGSGGYVVQPGDTLSAIAAANGITVHELAAENGIDPSGLLLAGARLNVPGAQVTSSEPATNSQPAASSEGAQPTDETVSPGDVGQVAADNGVSSSLAEAIADQESGFNNNEVSSTGAVGVMQIEPGTWSFIGQNLGATPPLSPTSAQDNVRGGVLLLHSLLDQTGGDPGLAAAGYYQGLGSVREHGLLPSTRRYVASVLALRNRFGGP